MVIGVRGLLHDEPLGRWDGSVVFSACHSPLSFTSILAGSSPDGDASQSKNTHKTNQPTRVHAKPVIIPARDGN